MPREIINVQVSCPQSLWRACIDGLVSLCARVAFARSLRYFSQAGQVMTILCGCCRCGRARLMCGAGCRLEIRSGRASGGCSLPSMAWTTMGCVVIPCPYGRPWVLKMTFAEQHYQGKDEQQLARVRLSRLHTTAVILKLSLRQGWRVLHRGRDGGLADEVCPAERADRPRGGCHQSCKSAQ